jgi:hypothetical protein
VAKHTLQLEDDYDFKLIGISSHVKDYRICWAINEILGVKLNKENSLEIKNKKQQTPSFFSFFNFDDIENFKEYIVVSNLSESKISTSNTHTLFPGSGKEIESLQNEYLIPELKHLNYFLIVKGELTEIENEEIMNKIKSIDTVLTAVSINPNTLKSKQNLIF